MKKIWFTLFTLLAFLTGCASQDGITIKRSSEGFKLFINGEETYIKGVGGTSRLDIARENGANAFRTWGGSVDEVRQILALAQQNNMYVMQVISLPKAPLLYFDEA